MRKGQAAMEFLMTYGWAILAAIIAIGVLAYYGVFSADKYAPTGTVVNQPFYAQASVNSSTIQLELRNNGGEDVNVTRINVATCNNTAITPERRIVPGNTSIISVTGCTTAPVSGKVYKSDVVVTYRLASSSLDKTSTGTLSEKAA